MIFNPLFSLMCNDLYTGLSVFCLMSFFPSAFFLSQEKEIMKEIMDNGPVQGKLMSKCDFVFVFTLNLLLNKTLNDYCS